MAEKGNLSKIKFLGSAAADLDFFEDGKMKVRINSLTDRDDKYKLRFSLGDCFIVGTGIGYKNKAVYELETKTRDYLYFSLVGYEPEMSEEEAEAIRKELEKEIEEESDDKGA